MYHHVYRLDHLETNEFYIGSRSSKVHPSLDPYMGSMYTWKPDKTKLKKSILRDDFESRDDAMQFEADTITTCINEELNRNYHIPHKGYHSVGQVTVIDKNGNTFNVSKDDPRFLSSELVGTTSGRFAVKNLENCIIMVTKDDPRYLSGEFVHISTGMVTVRDINENTFNVTKDDERYLSGELVPIWTGKQHTEKTKEKYKKTFSKIQHQKGATNSQFGTCWITNGIENKKIKKEHIEDYLIDNWYKGKVSLQCRGRKYIIKDNVKKCIDIDKLDSFLKNGWLLLKQLN